MITKIATITIPTKFISKNLLKIFILSAKPYPYSERKQVMTDRDLAELYGVETKRLNEQVKRNVERFPEHFRFQLSNQEKDELVANCDRFRGLKHSSVNPFAFTEFFAKYFFAMHLEVCGFLYNFAFENFAMLRS